MVFPSRPGGPARAGQQAVSRCCGVVVALLGLVALAGWAMASEPLTRLAPGLTPMPPAGAVMFALCGIGLALVGLPGAAARRAVTAAAGLTLIVALTTLAEHALGLDLRLDRVLTDAAEDEARRPSAHTAVAMYGAGATLLVLRGRFGSVRRQVAGSGIISRRPAPPDPLPIPPVLAAEPCDPGHPRSDAPTDNLFSDASFAAHQPLGQVPLLITALVVLSAVLGLAFGADELHGGDPGGMGLHLLLGLVALTAGLMSADPAVAPARWFVTHTPGSIAARRLVPTMVLVPISLGWLVLAGWEHELYGLRTGLAVLVAAIIAAFVAVTVSIARAVDVEHARSVARAAALAESEERFRTALDGAPIGMALAGTDGRWLRVNPALCAMTGRCESALLEGTLRDVAHPEDRELDAGPLAAVLRGERGSYTAEKRWLRGDGETIWVLLSIALVRDGDGAPRHLVAQVQDVSERKRHERELEHLADHDPLTGLFNRRRLAHELDREIARVERTGSGAALLLIDLDRFKQVNDAHGHQAGDEVIRAVARTLRNRVRTTDVAARLGGDEFAVLLVGVDARGGETAAESIAEAIRRAAVTLPGGRRVHLTASTGVAALRAGAGQRAEDLLIAADAAMYAAKEAGRDRVAVHTVNAPRPLT